jgi:hypothetical protein
MIVDHILKKEQAAYDESEEIVKHCTHNESGHSAIDLSPSALEAAVQRLSKYRDNIEQMRHELETCGVFALAPEETQSATLLVSEVGPMPHSALIELSRVMEQEEKRLMILESDLVERYGYPTFPSDEASARLELEKLRADCRLLEQHVNSVLNPDIDARY